MRNMGNPYRLKRFLDRLSLRSKYEYYQTAKFFERGFFWALLFWVFVGYGVFYVASITASQPYFVVNSNFTADENSDSNSDAILYSVVTDSLAVDIESAALLPLRPMATRYLNYSQMNHVQWFPRTELRPVYLAELPDDGVWRNPVKDRGKLLFVLLVLWVSFAAIVESLNKSIVRHINWSEVKISPATGGHKHENSTPKNIFLSTLLLFRKLFLNWGLFKRLIGSIVPSFIAAWLFQLFFG